MRETERESEKNVRDWEREKEREDRERWRERVIEKIERKSSSQRFIDEIRSGEGDALYLQGH